jgi:type II secretory pathway pseudopilin PulG
MSWQYQVRAEKEKQLLFVGAEFRNAINSYFANAPDAAKVYPATLNDLLLDKRMPNIKRHLRKIYLDPMTGKADWGVVKQQGRIVGIYSQSTLAPYKQSGFNAADLNFAGSRSYREWGFVVAGIETNLKVSTPSLSTNTSKNTFDAVSSSENKSNKEPVLYMQDGVITLNPKLAN